MNEDKDKGGKGALAKTIARQVTGAALGVGLWYADVKHLVIDKSLPLMTYMLPVGIAMGMNFKNLLKTMLKGSKFEGAFAEPEAKVTVPADLIIKGFDNGIRQEQLEEALKTGLSPEDIVKMIDANAERFGLMYKG